MADVTRRSYPSISAKHWWDLRRQLRQSIPETLDADFLRTALGVGEKHAKNMIRQLLGVGLIDQSGAPTELANQWRDDAGYPVACRRILQQIYPHALLDASPPPRPNPDVVKEWFATNTNAGRIAAARMASFYVVVAAADPSGRRRESPSIRDVDPARAKTKTPNAEPPREGPKVPDPRAPREKTKSSDAGPALESASTGEVEPASEQAIRPDVGPTRESARTGEAGPARDKTIRPDAGRVREKTKAPDAGSAGARAVGDERSRLAGARHGDDRRWMPPSPGTPSRESTFAQARNRYVVSHWRVVALSILMGGIAGFAGAALMPDVYVAETAVIATQSDVTADQIGPIAETAFSTDPVLQPVIDRLDLQSTPASLISTGALEARSLSDGPALLITGRASDPILAADLANAATDSFVAVAEVKGLGTFASFESSGPGTLEPHQPALSALLGVLTGAGVSLVVLVTVFFLGDPVVTEESARMDFHADAAFRLRVRERRSAGGADELHQADAFDVWPRAALISLWETIRERDGRGACAVIVSGGDAEWAAAAVARKLESRVENQGQRRGRLDGFSVSSTDPRLPEVLEASDAVVAIVPSGSPRRSLRRVDEELNGLGVRFRVLVLVDPSR